MQCHLTQCKDNTRSNEKKEHLLIFKRSKDNHLLSSRNPLRTKRRNNLAKRMGRQSVFFPWVPTQQMHCILIDPSISYNVQYSFSNNSGRNVLITVGINGQKVSFCNVYAPNNPSEQLEFIQELNNCIIDKCELTNLIVGGDWNCTLTKKR